MKQIGAAITLLMLAACGGSDSSSGSSTLTGASVSEGLGASSAASGASVGAATSTTGAATSVAGGTASGTASGAVPGTVPGTVPAGKMTLTTRVVDGPIQGAVVCTDKNLNGVCDAGEPQATTDANGIASLLIDTADNRKYPVLAVVGLGAIDAVNGSVKTAYTLLAPADESDFITPLSTLVAQHVITTGLPTSVAVEAIQSLASVVMPLGDPARFTAQDAALARLFVVTSQVLSTMLSPAVGQLALDGSIITNAAVSQIARSQLLRLLRESWQTAG